MPREPIIESALELEFDSLVVDPPVGNGKIAPQEWFGISNVPGAARLGHIKCWRIKQAWKSARTATHRRS
jgi:hypothetical protein